MQLFTIGGADRVDVVYSKDTGMLWVLSFVEIKDQPGKVSLYIDGGVATAADGGAVNNHASISVDYIPSPTAVAAANGTNNSGAFATAASWGVAGSLAVSFGAAVLSPTGAVGVGAINFAGFAQTFAMSGTLPITNMPSNYKAAASNMEWVALQPKIGPSSSAPTEEEKGQAAELANTTARFPYTPVEVKILPDGSFDPSSNIGLDGQTEEVVSVPVNNNSTDPNGDNEESDASDTEEETGSDADSTPITIPVLVIIIPLPEQDLVSSNGTKPSPFISQEEEETTNTASNENDNGGVTTVPTVAPGVQEPEQQQQQQQQQPEISGDADPVESIPSAPSGGIVIGTTPPAPVIQQAGEDSGIVIETPETPPAPVVQQAGEDSGIVIETPETPPSSVIQQAGEDTGFIIETPELPSSNESTEEEDTVVVALPENNITEKILSPPPSSFQMNSPPPGMVPADTSTGGGGEDDDDSSTTNGASSPPLAPDSNSNTPDAPSSPGEETGKDGKGLDESPSPPPLPSLSPLPPSNSSSSSDKDFGTAQQEGTEESGIIIDIPAAKLPAPAPLPSSPKPLTLAPAPAPSLSSKLPSPAPSSAKSPPRSPPPSPPIKVSPPPSAPPPAPTPAVEPVFVDMERENVDEVGVVDQDGHRVKPAQNNGSPVPRKSRHLLLNDPLTALSSSGFSYVVVTATTDGSDGATVGETTGASALSRIRTIQNAGEGPDADARRLDSLWDVLFWTAVAVVATLVLHLCVLGLLRWAKKSVPKMLHLPRLELLVFMMTLPMIAAAGAGLLKSTNGGIVTLGIFFSVVIPFGFLILASVFLVKYLLRSAVEQRRALYVLVATQDTQSELDRQRASSLGSTPEGSLTAAMLGPEAGDSLAEVGGASGSRTRISRAAAAAAGGSSEHGGFSNTTEQTTTPSLLRKTKSAIYTWVLRPVFGFEDSSAHAEALVNPNAAAWLGRGKWDAEFVKRYGCFFEDTHGPQVLRVRSRYDPTAISSSFNSMGTEDVVGSGVLVPATSTGAAEGALQALQTFGIIFAVTKMVLFAVIINGPGGVNNIGQVMALLVVALMHVVYLRLCHPYRLRIELAAEIIASVCDLAIFACGIALIAKPQWSPSERESMGIAMLALQAVGFLIFISVRVGLALRTLGKTVGPAVKDLWPKKLSFSSRTGGVGNRNTNNTTSESDTQFLSSQT